MKKGLTELVFILDRSGSMSGLESDTIGGYNSLLEKQKKEDGECVISTVLFDDKYELLHDRINLKGIVPITEREYFVRGSTALLDAVGRTIDKIGNAQKHTAEEERAEKVMFVITTDGMENSSREYGYDKVRQMIERQKDKYGWEFIFLGANIDAVETAARFGISADRAANYHADSEGTQLNYKVVSDAVSGFRANSAPMSADWKKRINEDYENRGGKKKKGVR
ncbi:von Willebrand factor type A [Clostridiales bacterium PH28_bin88]|nr:von Willebrand factor type A [Clostridiales bacterium PH28_bin88]